MMALTKSISSFNYQHPTEIVFGVGRVKEVVDIVKKFGQKCLIVVDPFISKQPVTSTVKEALVSADIAVDIFADVVPNPTTESVTEAAAMAKALKADVIVGIGGGSSMDTAKAVAVEATHEGTSWDYLFFKTPPSEKTLPVIAITTTSGTGSQVTQVAVVSNGKVKSAIFNPIVFPRVCIVDPELMLSVPPHVTACTGFDAFCHAFEGFTHTSATPYGDMLAVEAIKLVMHNLPSLVADGSNITTRSALAWADTLAGLTIANVGTTLPHGIGMTISGQCHWVSHGESLAVTYPAIMRFSWKSLIPKYAVLARILDPALEGQSDETAAEKSCELLDTFLKKINLWLSFEGLGVSKEDVVTIADNSQVLPDYKNHCRMTTRDEILEMLEASYVREGALMKKK